jgi:hypothetical protein
MGGGVVSGIEEQEVANDAEPIALNRWVEVGHGLCPTVEEPRSDVPRAAAVTPNEGIPAPQNNLLARVTASERATGCQILAQR